MRTFKHITLGAVYISTMLAINRRFFVLRCSCITTYTALRCSKIHDFCRSLAKSKLPLFFLGVFISVNTLAAKFESDASYSVCFTPGGACTTEIVDAINGAQNNIKVLAYSFTSKPIAGALKEAKKRGVDVEVILDKTQSDQEKYSSATFLDHYDIPVWIDYRPNISHNKVMLIDNTTTITGSFNFTRSAQTRNAENVLLIHDRKLTEQYVTNWEKRKAVSMKLSDYRVNPKPAVAANAGKDFEIIATSFLKALR